MKLTTALMKFFGKKKGQSLAEFVEETKALAPKDKTELAALLEEPLGETIEVNPAYEV